MTNSGRMALGATTVAALGLLMLRCSGASTGADADLGTGGTVVHEGAGGAVQPGTGGGPDDGGNGTGSGGGDCSGPDLEVTGQVVDPTELVGQQAPAPTGGTIVDGVYDVTSYVFYGDVDTTALAGDFRQTMRFVEGRVDIARLSGNHPTASRSTYSIRSDGTMLHLDAVCPPEIAGYQDSWAYSAFPDRIESYAEQLGATAILTYTKRP